MQQDAGTRTNSYPAIALLMLGAIAGVVLAAAGLLQGSPAVSPGEVARINGTVITSNQLDEFTSQINANTPVPRDRNYLLNQLIDEELLVQRGVELGLVTQSTPVRNAIVQAVTRRFSSGRSMAEISDAELRAYYEQHPDQFSPPPLYSVSVVTPHVRSAKDTPLTYPSLIEKFGPPLAAEIVKLKPGEQIESSESTIVQLVDVQLGEAPPFERVRELVQLNLSREHAEQAFREYVAWLRQRAEVNVSQQ